MVMMKIANKLQKIFTKPKKKVLLQVVCAEPTSSEPSATKLAIVADSLETKSDNHSTANRLYPNLSNLIQLESATEKVMDPQTLPPPKLNETSSSSSKDGTKEKTVNKKKLKPCDFYPITDMRKKNKSATCTHTGGVARHKTKTDTNKMLWAVPLDRKLKWTLHSSPTYLNRKLVIQTIERAFKMWSMVVSFEFEYDNDGDKTQKLKPKKPTVTNLEHMLQRKIHININFVESYHFASNGTVCRGFDGPGKSLAHAIYPPFGDIHLDLSEVWSIADQVDVTETNLFVTLLHEIGHVLGLEHSNNPNTIMYPEINRNQTNRSVFISHDDRNAVERLYGARIYMPGQSERLNALWHWDWVTDFDGTDRFFDASQIQAIVTSLDKSKPNVKKLIFSQQFVYGVDQFGQIVEAGGLRQWFVDFSGILKLAFTFNEQYYLVNTKGEYWTFADKLPSRSIRQKPSSIWHGFPLLKNDNRLPNQMFLWSGNSKTPAKEQTLYVSHDNIKYKCYVRPDVSGTIFTDWTTSVLPSERDKLLFVWPENQSLNFVYRTNKMYTLRPKNGTFEQGSVTVSSLLRRINNNKLFFDAVK
mgnify:CR=1 FL=1